MTAPLDDWLEPKLEEVSDELAAAVRACVDRLPARDAEGSVSETLARAALLEFDRLVSGAQGRKNAVRLLAADATLTYAFEAAAELDEDLEALVHTVGLRGALGQRVDELLEAPGEGVSPGAASHDPDGPDSPERSPN